MLKLFSKSNITKCVRFISTGNIVNGRSVTRESGVRPGSSEAKEPIRWAKRIFDQQHLKKNTYDPPHMLNLVVLTSNHAIPYYCRAILDKYHLLRSKCFKYRIVKNVPSVNEDLLKVANWIKVTPIKFPHGVPKTTKDFLNAQLRPDGSLMLHTGKVTNGQIIDEIDSLTKNRDKKLQAQSLIFDYNKHTNQSLKPMHVKKSNMYDWSRNNFLKGYFTSHYQYKHNQDGKEYRYSNNHRLKDALKQSMARRFNEDGTVRVNSTFEADWNTYPWKNY